MAITRDVTRVNPVATARGTIQRNYQLTVYKVVLNNTGLAALASDAAAAQVTDAIGQICNIVQVKSDGTEIFVVADRHAMSVDKLAQEIAKVLDTGTFTVSGGVATLSDSNTVTVTEPTDLEGM
jgi:hypothetical protein